MFRLISLSILSFFCLFSNAHLFADDATLLTTIDYCAGYGMELLYNDVNSDLLLMFPFGNYDEDVHDITSTDLRILLLQKGGDGKYSVASQQTAFETTRQIQQLDWTYDPVAKKFVVVLLDGERYGDERDIRIMFLNLDGTLSGTIKKLTTGEIVMNYPLISVVPNGTVGAPAQARYLFLGRGWIPDEQKTGIAAAFLNSSLNILGDAEYAVNEVYTKETGKPYFEPYKVMPSGDKKGFLISCMRRDNSDSDDFPTLVRLDGKAKYVKHLKVGNNESLYGTVTMHQVSKKKFAVAWVEKATGRFWSNVVSSKLRKVKTEKLLSEQPSCTDEFDDPYPIFCKPDGAKKNTVFFVGSKTDMTVYSLLMKKNGKTSNFQPVTWWNSEEIDGQYALDNWFVTAPIHGTGDIYCIAILRGEDELFVYGYMVSGN